MSMRTFYRSFSTTLALASKSISNRVIIPPSSPFNGPVQKSEYKQLPLDSDFIEKSYNELEQFSTDFLQKHLKKSYSDFENHPDQLVFELEKYIELHVIPRHSVSSGQMVNTGNRVLPMVYCKSMSDKLVIERFLDFCNGVKLTLRLNGGHTCIFDILLQGKAAFDQFEKRNASN
ncbi:LAFE_0E04060g1_1 [Lachancea fermentati]|uniref:LAFE_0E04060g1_1 n=1 Tax=Lachancea fermentati TaxID=4955 RepID=A0A1G4MCN6_LACFM|nr:LAFE_0E04060g1_1 [Lachancea fermentati]